MLVGKGMIVVNTIQILATFVPFVAQKLQLYSFYEAIQASEFVMFIACVYNLYA